MIKAKFLFGHSNKGYKLSCKNYALDKFSCPSHPHNTYLQIFVENGLVGFIFISSIFFFLTYILLKNFINLISNKELLNISEICFILGSLSKSMASCANWQFLQQLVINYILHPYSICVKRR